MTNIQLFFTLGFQNMCLLAQLQLTVRLNNLISINTSNETILYQALHHSVINGTL